MTSATSDEVARSAASEFARSLVPSWQAALGTELLGIYLIGSLAHGGFNRRYSDVDVAVVTEAGLSEQKVAGLRAEAAPLSADWAAKLSIFWADRHFSLGRFPPLDRIDYLDRPVALIEYDRMRPARPTLHEIRDYLRGAPFTNWAERARLFTAAPALDAKDRKAFLRALLYPARFCYGYMIGAMGSNDDAVAFVRERSPGGLDLASIERALRCRHDAADPDGLFFCRTLLPGQVDACAALFNERRKSNSVLLRKMDGA